MHGKFLINKIKILENIFYQLKVEIFICQKKRVEIFIRESKGQGDVMNF